MVSNVRRSIIDSLRIFCFKIIIFIRCESRKKSIGAAMFNVKWKGGGVASTIDKPLLIGNRHTGIYDLDIVSVRVMRIIMGKWVKVE